MLNRSFIDLDLFYFVWERVWAIYLYPSVKDVVFRLGRMYIFAVVKMIGCYHDDRRGVKLFSEIVFLSRKHK